MRVPFLDLTRQAQALERELEAAWRRVLARGQFILHTEVAAFEQAFAEFVGARAAIGVASGTDALQLALRACGLQAGDEVITVANAGTPTAAAIRLAGAAPIFVEIDPETLTIDPARVAQAITPRTRAVVPVHLYGRCAEMAPIVETARRHGLRVVEDCAQAHGAVWQGRHAGTWGDAGCFSFYPTKNLGAFGDGGLVVTSDPGIAERVRQLRTQTSSRLDELQAAILRVKLPHLETWNARRRAIATTYHRAFEPAGIRSPRPPQALEHVAHRFVVRVPDREAFRARLHAEGVETQVHYPTPLANLPETERACREVVSLPLFPEMTEAEIAWVIEACHQTVGARPTVAP